LIPLVNLADALDARFRETGNIDDIEEAIALFQEVYLLNPPQTEQSVRATAVVRNAVLAGDPKGLDYYVILI